MVKIAMCDDEIAMLEHLKAQVGQELKKRELPCSIAFFLTGELLLANPEYFDIIFLDIKMQGISGMETAKKLRQQERKAALVFVTGLKEYVFDAFEVNAVNYLLKPIDTNKLSATLDKILGDMKQNPETFLLLKAGAEIKKIKCTEIFYAEALNHKVFLYTKNGTEQYNKKIELLEPELDKNFYRCHRSYILNLRYVQNYGNGLAILTGGEQVPVAKRRQQEFAKALLVYQRKGVR